MRHYRLDASADLIAENFGADADQDPWAGGLVSPLQPAPVIVCSAARHRRRHLRPKLWGVPPPPRGTTPVTSVRNLASPFWIGTLRHPELRCLIPATSFAIASGPAGARRLGWFRLIDQPLFAIAGIHRQGEDWPSFAALATDPNQLIAHRGGATMPLILQPEEHDAWLGAGWSDLTRLATPIASQKIRLIETSCHAEFSPNNFILK